MKKSIFLFSILCFVLLLMSCKPALTKESNIQVEESRVNISDRLEIMINFTVAEDLPYKLEIRTSKVASLFFKLAKGDIFSARMFIWKYTDLAETRRTQNGDIIFYLLDANRKMLFDAGRIENEFEFSFEAPKSGNYIMVFDDESHQRFIELNHNYNGDFYYPFYYPAP